MDSLSPQNYRQQSLPFDDPFLEHQTDHKEPVKLTLREARMQLGLTQKEFAKRTSLPVSTVCYYEQNKSIRIKPASYVLATLNSIREEQGMNPLFLQDIDWEVHEWNMSPENKAKMSQRVKGEGNPMYGKIGAMKGRKQSPEHIQKRFESKKDTPVSEETRRKISAAKKGKKQSEIRRQKSSTAALGKKHTDEAKKRHSKAKSTYWEQFTKEERTDMLMPSIEAALNSKKRVLKDTKPEIAFEKKLNALGWQENIDYKKQFRIRSCLVDFYLIKSNQVVEIYGCWWHACLQCGHTQGIRKSRGQGIRSAESIREHDAKRIAYIESKGYIVKIIWQHEMRNLSLSIEAGKLQFSITKYS